VRVRSDLRVYRQLLPLLRPYRRRLGLALAAAPAAPLLLAGRIWLLKILIDTILRGHRPGLVPLVAAAFMAIAVLRGLVDGWVVSSSGFVGTHVVRDLRVRLFGQMQASSLRYFHGQRLGDLLTRLSQDIGAIEELLVTGLTAIAGYVITIVVFVTLLVLLDPALVLVACTVLPALAAVTVLDAGRGRRAQEHIRERTSELTSTASRPNPRGPGPSIESQPAPCSARGRDMETAWTLWPSAQLASRGRGPNNPPSLFWRARRLTRP
jgi:ATP-binding cassette subfamily B protein